MRESEPTLDRPAPPGGLAGRKVLVVEDSWTQRNHAVGLVQSLGAGEVLEARDGVEALEVLDRERDFDLVFCDLEMPRMDGVALIAELAAKDLQAHLVILSSQEKALLEAVRIMAVSYGLRRTTVLPKPLTREAVQRLLALPPASADAGPAPAGPGAPPWLTLESIREGMDRGQFECFFQPQYKMQNLAPKGVEALVRWNHPDHGLLAPAAFLREVEKDPETMSALTLKLLEGIAGRWLAWKGQGLELDVSVNLSNSSLGTHGFADQVLEAAERHGLNPRRTILEVTESASVSNLGHTLANLSRLRLRGFFLSLDDFGTGYATYEQLERIPFSELKIDLSITRQIAKSRRHGILARNLLRLAKDLRLHTVAEGIETLENWNALKLLGCDCGQGYFLGRPMPGDRILDWFARPGHPTGI